MVINLMKDVQGFYVDKYEMILRSTKILNKWRNIYKIFID